MKKPIMCICAAVLLLLGIYMNFNIDDFAMKAVTFQKFWEVIVSMICIAVICYALFDKSMGMKYTAVVVMALMFLYYIGNLIPFDTINDFLNGMNDTFLRIVSIVIIAGSVVWITVITKKCAANSGSAGN